MVSLVIPMLSLTVHIHTSKHFGQAGVTPLVVVDSHMLHGEDVHCHVLIMVHKDAQHGISCERTVYIYRNGK